MPYSSLDSRPNCLGLVKEASLTLDMQTTPLYSRPQHEEFILVLRITCLCDIVALSWFFPGVFPVNMPDAQPLVEPLLLVT